MTSSNTEQDGKRPVIINAYPNNGSSLPRRNQTLTRPERQTTLRRPLMRTIDRPPPAARAGATSGRTLNRPTNLAPIEDFEEEQTGLWTLTSKILTFWAIPPIRALFGVGKNKDIVQAWREKMSLCIIIFFCWCLMGFCTVGIQPLFCPDNSKKGFNVNSLLDAGKTQYLFYYNGRWFNKTVVNDHLQRSIGSSFEPIPDDFLGISIMPLFRECVKTSNTVNCGGSSNQIHPCKNFFKDDDEENKCVLKQGEKEYKYNGGECLNSVLMNSIFDNASGKNTKDWQAINEGSYTVYNGFVFDDYSAILSKVNSNSLGIYENYLKRAESKDGTRYFEMDKTTRDFGKCLIQSHSLSVVDKDTMGCFMSSVLTVIMTVAILGVVLTRFVMAIIFSWFVSSNLVQPNSRSAMRELYTICLVTAYSEGEEGIRCTLNSLATTTYPDKKRIIICYCRWYYCRFR